MTTKKDLAKPAFYASILAFIVFSIYILYINKDVLYTAQDRSEFFVGSQFFNTLLSKPFGLTQYAGAWLTQLFYHPALGASVLGFIWMLIFFIGKKAFRLQGAASALMLLPVAFLLTSTVDLGYWIYVFTIRGYWFSQSIGYLAMLFLLWVARCTPRKYHIAWYVFGVCIYPILGWFALLFVLCLILTDKLKWSEYIGIFLLIITANIWRALLYSHLNIYAVLMAGLPQFVNPSDSSPILSLPFWLIGAFSILFILFGKYLAKWFVPVACALAGIIFTCSFMYHDKNYVDEMRMVRFAENDNWEEVLNTYTEASEPTLSMVALKNIALMNEGGLLDRSFKMGNDGANIYNPDSILVSFLEIASPVAYYNYGMINEGFRLAFECGEQSGFCPFYIKMLARCAYANGESNLLDRYTTLLHGNLFYKNWQPAPVSEKVIELKNSYPNELTGVENSYSYIVNSICNWYEADSKVSSEQALFYSMMRNDASCFWPALRKFIKMHQGEDFPIHAQEAYIIFMDRAPEEKRMMIPVSEDVYARYKVFWERLEGYVKIGANQLEIPEKMRSEFGDTYWFFNIFGKKYATPQGLNLNSVSN